MRGILHLLVLIAFLGGIIAPACGFMWGGQYSVIEICTAQGIQSKIVDNDQLPQAPPEHKTKDQCQFCFAQAHLTSHSVPAIVIEPVTFQAEKLKFRLYESIYLSRVKSNLSARGPPVLV